MTIAFTRRRGGAEETSRGKVLFPLGTSVGGGAEVGGEDGRGSREGTKARRREGGVRAERRRCGGDKQGRGSLPFAGIGRQGGALGRGERVSRQLITEYRSELDRIHAASGSKRESVVREGFEDLLKRRVIVETSR